jgi:hypothetical protein
METLTRPWLTSGIAVIGASAIAVAPISPLTAAAPQHLVRAASTVSATEFQLTALNVPYILTLPIVRQEIRNWAANWAVYLGGLAKSGIGLAQSLLSIPGVTVEVLQQVLALDFVGAFDTITTAARDSVVAVGQPLLDSIIWRNQKYYAVQTALRAAVPQALIDVANGFLSAGSEVTTSLIEGTQEVVAAILTLNLGNIVNAALDGTKGFVVALGTGAGDIIGGIESAQRGIATALATPPPSAATAELTTTTTEKTLPSMSEARPDVSDIAKGGLADLTLKLPTRPVRPRGTAASSVLTELASPASGMRTPKRPVHPVSDAIKNARKSVSRLANDVEKSVGARHQHHATLGAKPASAAN